MEVELLAITPKPEQLIETAARTCYQSNDRMSEESAPKLIRRLLKMGHESPLEHAYASFLLCGVSRAMTHQLVRHRLMAVSQKSQRFVSEEGFSYVAPPSIEEGYKEEFEQDMETIRRMYEKWRGKDVRPEDARFVLPNACSSEIVISANFREFRHIFELRCDRAAQWEIRACALEMLGTLKEYAPTVFEDQVEEFLENA